jgi:hypothetical protein
MLHWWASSPRHFEDHHAFISREKQWTRNSYVGKQCVVQVRLMQVKACKSAWQANYNGMVMGKWHWRWRQYNTTNHWEQYSPNNTTSHPTRLQSSSTPLWEPKILLELITSKQYTKVRWEDRTHCGTASRPSKQILHTGTNKKFLNGEDKELRMWHTTKYPTQNPPRHLTFCRTDTSLAPARKQITYVRPVTSSLCYATDSPHEIQCSYNRMKTLHKTNKHIN